VRLFFLYIESNDKNRQERRKNMSTFTKNYNLIKPQEEDYYDVQDFNENMDAIDAQMMQTEVEVAGLEITLSSIDQKLGSFTNAENNTIFGLLKNIPNLVKSIQRTKINFNSRGNAVTASISPVNPSRCLVLSEQLVHNSDFSYTYDYVLSETTLELTVKGSREYELTWAFWIIEFY